MHTFSHMSSNNEMLIPARIKEELQQEKTNLALAFHRGKSLADLKDLVSKIHCLEEKLVAILN
jgi:hypothetical protein